MTENKWTKYHWRLPKETEEKLQALADKMMMSRAYTLRYLVEQEYKLLHKEDEKVDESR